MGYVLNPRLVKTTPGSLGQSQQTPWIIPVGKYGLQLANGTRITGQPAAGWSATFKTDFGTVVIPLRQISQIAPNKTGQFSAFLKNGDRVTGTLVSSSLKFETQFGFLQVASSDIVRLQTSNQAVAAVVKPTAGKVVTGKTSSEKPSNSRARRAIELIRQRLRERVRVIRAVPQKE